MLRQAIRAKSFDGAVSNFMSAYVVLSEKREIAEANASAGYIVQVNYPNPGVKLVTRGFTWIWWVASWANTGASKNAARNRFDGEKGPGLPELATLARLFGARFERDYRAAAWVSRIWSSRRTSSRGLNGLATMSRMPHFSIISCCSSSKPLAVSIRMGNSRVAGLPRIC